MHGSGCWAQVIYNSRTIYIRQFSEHRTDKDQRTRLVDSPLRTKQLILLYEIIAYNADSNLLGVFREGENIEVTVNIKLLMPASDHSFSPVPGRLSRENRRLTVNGQQIVL